ncbi:MAG: PEP-CTERM sorting domain-containing protein [bacterium]
MKIKSKFLKTGIFTFFFIILFLSSSKAISFDTNDKLQALESTQWPWSDSNVTRYQLWISENWLMDYTGTITSIKHFTWNTHEDPLYNLNIYISSTDVIGDDLSADSPDSNHGSNKTLIYSGNLPLPGDTTFTIDVDDVFYYNGTGNLLIDYSFNTNNGYTDLWWQAVGQNSNFFQVVNHNIIGNYMFDSGAIRTQLEFSSSTPQIPEPGTMHLLGSLAAGLFSFAGLRRKFTK